MFCDFRCPGQLQSEVIYWKIPYTSNLDVFDYILVWIAWESFKLPFSVLPRMMLIQLYSISILCTLLYSLVTWQLCCLTEKLLYYGAWVQIHTHLMLYHNPYIHHFSFHVGILSSHIIPRGMVSIAQCLLSKCGKGQVYITHFDYIAMFTYFNSYY